MTDCNCLDCQYGMPDMIQNAKKESVIDKLLSHLHTDKESAGDNHDGTPPEYIDIPTPYLPGRFVAPTGTQRYIRADLIDADPRDFLNDMEVQVMEWAQHRGIFEKGTPLSQHSKTIEEVQELTDALNDNDGPATKDAIGDTAITLIIQAHMHGMTLSDCLSAAWEEIKDRTGEMVDGVFVKDHS